jgi:hypothetical protein
MEASSCDFSAAQLRALRRPRHLRDVAGNADGPRWPARSLVLRAISLVVALGSSTAVAIVAEISLI